MMNYRLALISLIFLLLSACGFHLKGSSQIANNLNPLYLEPDGLESAQLSLIRQELIRSSARLSLQAVDSNRLHVRISPLKTSRIARSGVADVELLKITMSIQYSVQSDATVFLVAPGELVQSMEVEINNANVLANENIINRVQLVLQRRLIQNMILQLAR